MITYGEMNITTIHDSRRWESLLKFRDKLIKEVVAKQLNLNIVTDKKQII